MARLARLAAVCSVIAASLTGAALGTATPSGATPTLVATGGNGAATIEADEGTVVELRPIDGTPTSPPGGTVGSTGELEVDPVDPGLYEVWSHDGTPPFTYATRVVVRTSGGQQDLLAQSEEVDADPVHRFGYVEVGSGPLRTLLSFDLRLPGELALPYGTCDPEAEPEPVPACVDELPALLEYSGYDPSNPAPNIEREAWLDSEAEVSRGYAALAVNVRGTGCSGDEMGGSPVTVQQAEDGAEVVDVLGTQTWSTGRVGMVGTSVPGIEQLNVAAQNPEHLVAITPAGVTGRPYDDAYPGGIPSRHFDIWSTRDALLNAPPSFTDQMRQDIIEEAFGYQVPYWATQPGPDPEHPGTPKLDQQAGSWVFLRSAEDPICSHNAAQHAGEPFMRDLTDANPTLTSNGPWASLDLRKKLADTTVPTLLIEGLNDEFAPRGFDRLLDATDETEVEPAAVGVPASAPRDGEGDPVPLDGSGVPNPLVRVVTGSGSHNLSASAEAMTERDAFLDLLVAERAVPTTAGTIPRLRPSNVTTCLPAYLDEEDTTRSDQLAALYRADPVILYWEQTQPLSDGFPLPVPAAEPVGLESECNGSRFVSTATSWPLTATPDTFPFGAHRALLLEGPLEEEAPSDEVAFDAVARNSTWESLGRPHVSRPPSGELATFTSTPLVATTAYAGPASVDLSLVSDDPIVDLEVSISEVGADGSETFVRSGWRRTSVPEETESISSLQPRLKASTVATCSEEPIPEQCLDDDVPTTVRVPISSFAHIFRAGSRIRVSVSGPGYSELGMPFLTQMGDRPAARTGAHVSIEVGGSNTGQLVMSAAANPSAIGTDPGIGTPPTCGTVSNVACYQRQVTVTAQHPYDGNDETVLHVDWDTDTVGPEVDGFHVYFDDDVTPVATVDRPLYPGNLGIPALSSSTDITVDEEDEPTLVRVAPFVHQDDPSPADVDLAEFETSSISVPSTDGDPGEQLLDEDSATGEGLELTDPPRWTRFDEQATLAVVSSGHASSGKAVELTVAPDASLPLATFGVDESDIFAVTPGQPYHLEAWFEGGPDATRAGLAILWWDIEGDVHLSVKPIDLAANQGWTLLALNADPPPGAVEATAAAVMLDPDIDANSVTRSVTVDDLAFCAGQLACVPPS